MIRYILFYGLSVIIRWRWMLCRALRYFSCSYCVAIMLLKAFDYTMIIGVVLRDEVFFMLLLRGNYAFESLWLYDDGGCCVARWDVFHVVTAWQLCFWKSFNIRWQCVLCLFLKAGSMINSVRVVLLKARGWRGTSLPRVSDNMLFSNPVRVLLLPIT